MKTVLIGALGLLALGGTAHAQSYADDVCRDLRAERPNLSAPIAVTGRQPVRSHGRVFDKVSRWTCPALNVAGAMQRPVVAETPMPIDLRSPFQD